MSTRVTTGKVRFSYCNLFQPRESQNGGDPKYSVTLLIPKSDKATMKLIQEAIREAAEIFKAKHGPNSLPVKPINTLHDGDSTRESGDPFGDECKGCYVITVSSKSKPLVVDAFKNEITDLDEVYSGSYGRAIINFYAYSKNGKKGISAGLKGIMKLYDGEPLGGTKITADAFDDGWTDDAEDGLSDLL